MIKLSQNTVVKVLQAQTNQSKGIKLIGIRDKDLVTLRGYSRINFKVLIWEIETVCQMLEVKWLRVHIRLKELEMYIQIQPILSIVPKIKTHLAMLL